jgi:hypothetical protein
MIVELIMAQVFWLNVFPPSDGVSPTLSPRYLLTGIEIDYHKHCKTEFGTYVQTHEEHDNSMTPRTVGAIALRPIGNAQGGWYFMALATVESQSMDCSPDARRSNYRSPSSCSPRQGRPKPILP